MQAWQTDEGRTPSVPGSTASHSGCAQVFRLSQNTKKGARAIPGADPAAAAIAGGGWVIGVMAADRSMSSTSTGDDCVRTKGVAE